MPLDVTGHLNKDKDNAMNNLELTEQLSLALYRPHLMQEVALEYMEETYNGTIRVVDPNNPFMLLMETMISSASASAEHSLLSQSNRFAVLANNEDELYQHLNIGDVEERFAQPGGSTFTVKVNYDAIVKYAILSEDGLYKKLRIPKDSFVGVDDLAFTISHAIEIRLYEDRIKIVQDVDTGLNEFNPLDSNVIPYTTIRDSQRYTWVFFDIYVKEHRRYTRSWEISESIAFKKTLSYQGEFHNLIATHTINGNVVDLPVNYNTGRFNPSEPELLVKVTDSEITLEVMPLYQELSLLGSTITVLLFTTNGGVTLDLSTLQGGDFTTYLRDDTRELNVYEKAFDKTSFFIDSIDSVNNGRSALTFAELKAAHLTASFGQPESPITENNLANYVSKSGNLLTKSTNTVAGRTFISTSGQPVNTDYLPVTEIPTGYSHIEASFEDLSALSTSVLSEDGLRCMLLDKNHYSVTEFDAEVLDELTTSQWSLETVEALNLIFNGGDYRYSPWVYAFYADGLQLTVKAFEIDNGEFYRKSYSDHNVTTNLYLNSEAQEVTFNRDTYSSIKLSLTVAEDPTLSTIQESAINTQLRFLGKSGNYRYINSEELYRTIDTGLLTSDVVIEFVNSDTAGAGLDILADGWLRVTNARDINGNEVIDHIGLDSEVNITFVTSELGVTTDYVADDISENVMQESQVSHRYGVSVETYRLRLARDLEYLHIPIRAIGSEVLYQTADDTIYHTYTENVLAKYSFSDTGDDLLPFEITNSCAIGAIFEHKIGDYVLRSTTSHLVDGSISSNTIQKTEDINGRNALDVNYGDVVYVRDASGDPTVIDSISAFYIYKPLSLTSSGLSPLIVENSTPYFQGTVTNSDIVEVSVSYPTGITIPMDLVSGDYTVVAPTTIVDGSYTFTGYDSDGEIVSVKSLIRSTSGGEVTYALDAANSDGNWYRKTDFTEYLAVKYNKGDYLLDAYGNAIPEAISHYQHRVSLMTIPSEYRYVTNDDTLSQLDYVKDNIVRESTNEIMQVEGDFLENSDLYYKPKEGLGPIHVYIGDESYLWIDSEASGTVTVRCEKTVVNNDAMRATLTENAKLIIDEYFKKKIINRQEITAAILDNFGDSVTSVNLELNIFDEVDTFSIVDDTCQITVKKDVATHSTLTRYVTESLIFDFVAF